jgi:hypothetical protein
MSLGLARDSIANLQSLAHLAEKDDFTKAPSSNFFYKDEDNDGEDTLLIDIQMKI